MTFRCAMAETNGIGGLVTRILPAKYPSQLCH